MNYVCCNILCMTCSHLQPFSANISKSTKLFIFCSQGIFPSIVHILKTHTVFLTQQHYFHPHCPVVHTLRHSHIYNTYNCFPHTCSCTHTNTYNCFPTLTVAHTLSVHFAILRFTTLCKQTLPEFSTKPAANVTRFEYVRCVVHFHLVQLTLGMSKCSVRESRCLLNSCTHTTHIVLLNI